MPLDLVCLRSTSRQAIKVNSEHNLDRQAGLNMENPVLNTHPSTAVEAKAFTAPHSLSFPGGAGHITPPSEKESQSSHQPAVNGAAPASGTGATPATPAATPGAGQGVSGIIPTLQNLVATVNLDCRVSTRLTCLMFTNTLLMHFFSLI